MEQGIYFLVEEKSMKIALDNILPKIIGEQKYRIADHQGKLDLQRSIRKTLPALVRSHYYRLIVILQDRDQEDCRDVKGGIIQNIPRSPHCPIKVRIVCRELENWYFGDLNAIQQAYPRFKADKHRNKRKFRDPDEIQNAMSELTGIIPELSKKRISKTKFAAEITPHMSVDSNSNQSFNKFKEIFDEQH